MVGPPSIISDVLFDTFWSADLDSLLADHKFQDQAVSVCSGCSLGISDKKLLSISTGETPIPGNSLRSLGCATNCPVVDLSSKSPNVTARMNSHEKNQADDTPRAEHEVSADGQRMIAQVHPKANPGVGSKVGNFAFLCAWKDVPEIQRLFEVCAASAVGGFQVCFIRSSAISLIQQP